MGAAEENLNQHLGKLVEQTILWGLGLSAFASATLLPGSSEALLTGLLWEFPEHRWSLWAVATLGNSLGSFTNWGLGRFLLQFLGRRWFPVSPEQYERATSWFSRYGIWTLLLAWTPILGDPLTVVAGALRVRFAVFCGLVTLGKALRYAFIVGAVVWGKEMLWS
jgi:membrane protein YqaA with SNARE-associated domain